MTQAGGPAAINGFLYQILHHIEWVADVSLKEADQEVKNALLVFEPYNITRHKWWRRTDGGI